MSISTRISIQFPPALASETTDTLVLSFKSHYLDLRIPRADYTSIHMGFAGTLSHPAPNTTRWEHDIDSNPSGGVDEGIFTKLPNGDDVEEGTMENPETGEEGVYKEVWRTIPAEVGSCAYCLESAPANGGSESNGKSKSKSFVGRIGLYYLCMGQDSQDSADGGKGFSFSARRYQLESGKWRKVYHIGEMDLPEPEDINEEVEEGGTVKVGKTVYTVKESFAVQ